MRKKYFIITIDTEGDNLWEWQEGSPIGTENTKFLPRFQNLCDKYEFKPTWFTNWEMANDDRFVSFASDNMRQGRCEVGMHLHAWNTPPEFDLPKAQNAGLPYLIEYPVNVMKEKVITMTNLIETKFGKRPVVHRAGRWAINDDYFEILHDLGYIADASITPYVDWTTSVGRTANFPGPDYSKENSGISIRKGVIEVPVTTLWSKDKTRAIWLRPNRRNLDDMLYLIEQKYNSDCDYLMFMLHSSELMAGGNPTFKYEGGIERLYEHLEIIFKEIFKNYIGVGLEEYVSLHNRFNAWSKVNEDN